MVAAARFAFPCGATLPGRAAKYVRLTYIELQSKRRTPRWQQGQLGDRDRQPDRLRRDAARRPRRLRPAQATPTQARAVLRRAVELGVDHIDTAQFYGPDTVNELIREDAPSLPRGPPAGDQGRRPPRRRGRLAAGPLARPSCATRSRTTCAAPGRAARPGQPAPDGRGRRTRSALEPEAGLGDPGRAPRGGQARPDRDLDRPGRGRRARPRADRARRGPELVQHHRPGRPADPRALPPSAGSPTSPTSRSARPSPAARRARRRRGDRHRRRQARRHHLAGRPRLAPRPRTRTCC